MLPLSFAFTFFLFAVVSELPFFSYVLFITFIFVFLTVTLSFHPTSSSLTSALVLLLFLVVSTFVVTHSLMVFFIMYELSLVPVCLLILFLGYQPEKLNAMLWLLLYTVVCSLPLFFYTFSNNFSVCYGLSSLSPLASLVVCLSFIVKAPLYTLHSWLPKAHVEAPLVGSMLLAGVMLKLGGYGLLILSPSLCWHSSLYLYLSLTGGVVCSSICYRYWDMKSLVAYSSIVHIGVVTVSALCGSDLGLHVALFILVSHSFLSPLLFLLAFELYLSTGSRNFIFGHCCTIPVSLLFVLCLCSGINFGLPPFISFWVELTIFGVLGSYCSLFLVLAFLTAWLSFLYSISFYVLSSGGRSSPLASPLPNLYSFVAPIAYSFLFVFV